MQVKALRLVNFRNYASLSLRPDPGLCVLTGENAAGKTNILEAVFLCALGRSHRTVRDEELIKADEGGGYAGVTVDTLGGTREIEMKLAAGERRKTLVDKSPIAKSGELMGVLNVVMFAPEDLTLVKDGPGERRRFLNMMISQLQPSYYYALQKYNQALKQRNALLKDPEPPSPGALAPWDEQLSVLGAGIMLARAEQIARLADVASDLHETLSDGREFLEAAYQPNFPLGERTSLVDRLRDAFAANAERDLRYGSTTAGPHRDDLLLTLDGADVRIYGSQGQQRTTALSLKLAQLEMLREDKGEAPVLLLDDVFSELDKRRQQMLLIAVQGCQTFLTCTHLEQLTDAGAASMQVYTVANGDVLEV